MERYILANLDRMFGGKNKMNCNDKQQETCDVEKRTCERMLL